MIIALTGHAGHGKDFAGNILAWDFGFVKRSFAGPLKAAARSMFDWTEEHTDGDLKDKIDPRWGISPRRAMQLLGTEFGQQALQGEPTFRLKTGRNLWVNRCLDDMREHRRYVVTDCRFIHEAEAIKQAGGVVVRIVRPSVIPDLSHPSESELLQIKEDFTVDNSLGVEHLRVQLVAILAELGR